MPRIRSAVHHQPTPARARSSATSPSLVRAAAHAGASPAEADARSSVAAITRSGGPGELGCREARLALVLDPEGADPRPLRLGGVELRGGRVEHADEPDRLS